MKQFAITADWHIGATHPRFPDLTNHIQRAIHRLLEENKRVIVLGDIFHTSRPNVHDVDDLMECLLYHKDTEIIIMPGNHDKSRDGYATHILKHIEHSGLKIIEEESSHFLFHDFKAYFCPWPDRAMRPNELYEISPEIPPDVFFLHGPVAGHPNVPPNSWAYDIKTGAEHPHVVFAGDLHQPIVTSAAAYPGSLVPMNFAETHNAGYLHVDTMGLITRIVLPYFPRFSTIEADLNSESAFYMLVNELDYTDQLVAVRCLLTGRSAAYRERLDATYADNPLFTFEYHEESKIREKASEIAKATTPEDSYKRYLEYLATTDPDIATSVAELLETGKMFMID